MFCVTAGGGSSSSSTDIGMEAASMRSMDLLTIAPDLQFFLAQLAIRCVVLVKVSDCEYPRVYILPFRASLIPSNLGFFGASLVLSFLDWPWSLFLDCLVMLFPYG